MILVLLATSVITAASQILFKQATTVAGGDVSTTYVQRFLELLMMPSFLCALFLYGAAFILWIWLLSKNSLSILYPVGLSLNVILALVAARLYLHESITPLHLIGIAVIVIGIFLVAR